jgi:hypothetical protein
LARSALPLWAYRVVSGRPLPTALDLAFWIARAVVRKTTVFAVQFRLHPVRLAEPYSLRMPLENSKSLETKGEKPTTERPEKCPPSIEPYDPGTSSGRGTCRDSCPRRKARLVLASRGGNLALVSRHCFDQQHLFASPERRPSDCRSESHARWLLHVCPPRLSSCV